MTVIVFRQKQHENNGNGQFSSCDRVFLKKLYTRCYNFIALSSTVNIPNIFIWGLQTPEIKAIYHNTWSEFLGTRYVCNFPVGKIDEKAVCRSVFLTIWHCIGEYYLRGEISQDINYRSFGGLKFISANKFFRFFF